MSLLPYELTPIESYPSIKSILLEHETQTPITLTDMDQSGILQPPAPEHPQSTNPTLPITINASQKEVKMNTPTPFMEEKKKLEEFLIKTDMYLTMNDEMYNNDQRKIIFALSFMKDGTAGPWKQSFWTQARENKTLGTWRQFKKALRELFSAPDKEGDTVTKMETEMMSGKMANKHIEQFKIYAAESKIMQDRSLIEWFMKGLNTPLLDRILNLENPMTMIQGWYTTASKIDNQ